MELRHLRYFVAVGEVLSFTKAAERLHLAQPSLTRQIQDLEAEIGVRLFHRNKRQVSLTPEGRSFLADAKKVLAHSSDIVESVQRLHRRETAALNIGYMANFFPTPLSVSLAAFQRRFPMVSVNLFDMSYGDQFRALDQGRIDLGFVKMQPPALESRDLQFRSLGSDRIIVALREGDELKQNAVIRLRDLGSMFFIGMSEKSYPGYRSWLTATCRLAGFAPKVLQDVELERVVLQAVGAGLGVALLPEQVEKLPHENVIFRPLAPTVRTMSCIAWKKENTSTVLKAYIDVLKDRSASMR
jgi:DNA-binding transcriptional LysR family regulator